MYFWFLLNFARTLDDLSTSKIFLATGAGAWLMFKYEKILVWAEKKYGVNLMDHEDTTFRGKYPKQAERLDDLEARLDAWDEWRKT